ncbi:hypothetical protein V1517DRAFT_13794 [Lipomyces orientalis]|uniref:Uncharacterized protein n=1 Tax=Lipomyces orientalis TaxID=1233043 RepID=A0ACC3TV24_9ASCO
MPVQRPPTPYEPSICSNDDREIQLDNDRPVHATSMASESNCAVESPCTDRDTAAPQAPTSGAGADAMSMSRHSSSSSSHQASSLSASIESTPPTSPSTIGSLPSNVLTSPTIRVRFADKPEGPIPQWVKDATAITAACLASEKMNGTETLKMEVVPKKEAATASSRIVPLPESRNCKIRELVEKYGYAKIHKSPILMRKMLGRATLEELPDDRHYTTRVLVLQDEGFERTTNCDCSGMFVDAMLDAARSSKLLEADDPVPSKKGFRPQYFMADLNTVSDGGDNSERETLWSYKFPKTTIHAIGIKTRAPPKNVPPAFFDDITPRVLLWAPDIIIVRVNEDDPGWERQLNYTRLMSKKIVVVIDAAFAEVADNLRRKVVTRVITWHTGHMLDITGPSGMRAGSVIERYDSTRGKSKLVSSTKWLLSAAYINFFFVNSEDQKSFVILHEFLGVFCRARGVFSFTFPDNKSKKAIRYSDDSYGIDGVAKVRFNADVVEFGSDDDLSDSNMDDSIQDRTPTADEFSKTECVDSIRTCAELVDMGMEQLPLAYVVSGRSVPDDGFYLDVVCLCGYFNKKERYVLGPVPGTNTFYPIVVRKIISKCTKQHLNFFRAGDNAVIRLSFPEYKGDPLVPKKLLTLFDRDPRAFRRMALSIGYNPNPAVTRLFQSAARFFSRAKNNKILHLAPVVSAVVILDSEFGQFKTNGQDVLKPGEFLMIQSGAKAKLVRMLGRVRGYRAICVRMTTDDEEKNYVWGKLPGKLNLNDRRISYRCDEEGDYFYEGERVTVSEIVDNGNFEFDAVRYSGTVDSVTYDSA